MLVVQMKLGSLHVAHTLFQFLWRRLENYQQESHRSAYSVQMADFCTGKQRTSFFVETVSHGIPVLWKYTTNNGLENEVFSPIVVHGAIYVMNGSTLEVLGLPDAWCRFEKPAV